MKYEIKFNKLGLWIINFFILFLMPSFKNNCEYKVKCDCFKIL